MILKLNWNGLKIMYKIKRPYIKSFNTLLNGKVISYSQRVNRIAIGKEAIKVPQSVMQKIVDTSDAYGDRFALVVKTFSVYALWDAL